MVLKLTKRCPEGTFIYFDNLFSSHELLSALKKRGKHFVCTVRPCRIKDVPLTEKKDFEKTDRGNIFDHQFLLLDSVSYLPTSFDLQVLAKCSIIQ